MSDVIELNPIAKTYAYTEARAVDAAIGSTFPHKRWKKVSIIFLSR